MSSSSNMSGKVRASTKVALPASTPQPHAPRQQTGASPGGINTISSKVRPSTKVPRPAPEVRGHAPPTPYPYNRPTPEPVRGHATQKVLSDTAKLTPSLARGIRKAAAAK